MANKKIGITLSDITIENLDVICSEMGLSKSQAIALAVNTYFNEKLKGENHNDKKKK